MRVTIVMGNQGLSMVGNILKILKTFMSMLYLMFYPFILENASGDEGNKSSAKRGDKSNKNSSPPMNLDIKRYQVQIMNVNHIKYKLSNILKPCMVQNTLMKNF